LVRYYTPLNEPFVNAEFCGQIKRWPPYLEGDSGFIMVMKNLCFGIIETVNGIRSIDPNAVMVHVQATGLTLTNDPNLQTNVDELFNKRLTQFELITGRILEGHPLYNWLVENGMRDYELQWFQRNAILIDIMGLNYYPELSVSEMYKENGQLKIKSVWGGTSGFESIIKSYYQRYKRPIFIAETSTNAKRGNRVNWLKDSIRSVKQLRDEGIPVIGYTWWPLYDLINWDYREENAPVENYLEPMGLWELKMGFDRVFRRVPTEAASVFKEVIHSFQI
jgi:beta-glucosidase/6-phospho-beta-glucosidase/beta-galactosidase